MKSSVQPKKQTKRDNRLCRPWGVLCLSLWLSYGLASCAGVPSNPTHSAARQTATAAVAASAYKAGPDDVSALSVRIEADGQNQKLRVSLSPRLVSKSRSDKGFRTQASDISQLSYLTLSVSGPDIRTPIQNTGGLIPITGVSNQDIVIEGVPRGVNHVVTAQFYDADQLPVTNAVAMGVYSSRDGTNVSVLRRFLTLGRVLKSLFVSNASLARNLDVAALQAKIDQVLYGSTTPGPFVVDPSLINIDQIVADVAANGGNIASLNLSQPIYVFETSSLTLPVTGLLGSDTLTVRVDDPTSTAVTQGNGTITIHNIAPGTWPVYVKLNSTSGFSYPNTTLGTTVIPPSVPNQTTPSRVLVSAQSFTPSNTAALATYTLLPADLQFTTAPGLFTRSGQQLTITGSGFYPGSTTLNKVRFTRGATDLDATVVSATATELLVTVPAAAQAGDYDLKLAVGNGSYTSLGTAVLNVLTATANGPDYNALTSNGQGWSKAINLQSALAQAVAGDEIWVAAGVHKPVIPVNPASVTVSERQATFQLKANVAVYGGFAGNETSLTARNFSTNVTTLSGDIDNVTDIYDTVISNGLTHTGITGNSMHVVKGVTGATLDGFTISGGNANGGGSENDGGGMVNNPNANPSLSNLIFTGNTASNNGGGMVNDNNSNPTVNQVIFRYNAAAQSGGMANFISSPVLTEVSFIENTGTTNGGGGMFNVTASPSLTNVLFLNNKAGNGMVGNGAGGMYNHSNSSPSLTNVVFSGNIANGNGGAMHNYNNSSPVLTNVIFTNNSASTTGGGGIYNSGTGCNPKLVNVSFSNNTGPSGGGVYSVGGSGTTTYANVLFWNSSLTGTSAPGGQGNLIAAADPFFNSADPDGADDQWLTADDGLALNAGMPGTAIDQGLASVGGFTIPTTDAVGIARPQGLYDPGSYELAYQPLSLNITSGKSGDQVIITGSNLTGATSVKFNGTEASSFTIDSSTQITARVPFGLVSNGKVSVLTPSGPALSSSSFTITSRIHLVKANASGNGAGNSWTNAHPSLQTALTNAVAGDEIWVAAGTYKPGTLRTDTFTLKSNVPIYGGFAGTEFLRTDRDFNTNMSILEGDLNGNDNATVSVGDPNRSENSYHVVTTSVANTTLDGLTIQGGHAFSGATDGGGFLNNNVVSNLTNMVFKSNTAVNGGGLFLNGGNANLNNVSFIGNVANNAGAGMFTQGSASPTLTNVRFVNNSAVNGGGIYGSSGTLNISNCRFFNNSASGGLGGGGLYNGPGSSANVNNSVFMGNTATNGGAVYNYTSSPIYANVIFTGNSTGGRGGGMYNTFTSSPKLINVTFNGNSATSGGSALYNNSGSPVFVNVLLWNNVLGNIALPGSQGNVQAGSDPFVNSADPDGVDDIWFTPDDGLQLTSSFDLGVATFPGVTIPPSDVLLTARPQGAAHDSGAYEKP